MSKNRDIKKGHSSRFPNVYVSAMDLSARGAWVLRGEI